MHAFNPGLVRTDMLGRIDAVRGYGPGLNRFGSVIGVLGLDADEAALGRARPDRQRPAGVPRHCPAVAAAQAAQSGRRGCRLRGAA